MLWLCAGFKMAPVAYNSRILAQSAKCLPQKPVLIAELIPPVCAFYLFKRPGWTWKRKRSVRETHQQAKPAKFCAASTSRALCYPRVAVYAAVRASSEAYNTIHFESLHSTAINDRCDTIPSSVAQSGFLAAAYEQHESNRASRIRCRRDMHSS